MNSANLQLEGLYLVLISLTGALRDKGLLNQQEIVEALNRAEAACLAEATRLSPANLDAVRFPARILRAAQQATTTADPQSFSTLAALVGETAPRAAGHPAQPEETA